MSPERLRRSYADDATLSDRVFELLETWFTGISQPRAIAARLGSLWDDCSTPFVVEKQGQIISHVGLLDMSYVIRGERHQLGGVHGVCTLESERRQGHFRRIMEELLEFCEGRYETLELGTENPEYYEPFGFRVVPEHRFVARVASPGGRDGFAPFDPTTTSDLALLDRLLGERTAVSKRVGVVNELDVFKFSQGTPRLHYCEQLDCLAVLEIEGDRLLLSDVVARELPSLESLLAQLAPPLAEVEFHFSPDRFEVDARPEPFRYDDDYYMVRGPLRGRGRSLHGASSRPPRARFPLASDRRIHPPSYREAPPRHRQLALAFARWCSESGVPWEFRRVCRGPREAPLGTISSRDFSYHGRKEKLSCIANSTKPDWRVSNARDRRSSGIRRCIGSPSTNWTAPRS